MAEGREELEGEGASDDGGLGQDATGALVDAFEAAADDETDTLGDFDLADLDIGAPGAGVVEEAALLGEVAVYLLDEEGHSFGLVGDEGGEGRGRRLPAEGLEQAGDVVFVEATEGDALDVSKAREAVEGAGERLLGVEVGVAVGADDEHRPFGDAFGNVFEEQRRGLVGPMQVVEEEGDGLAGGGAFEVLGEAGKKEVAGLLGREIGGLWEIREGLAEAGHDPGDLGGAVAHLCLNEVGAGDADGVVERLGKGDEGRSALHLVAVAGGDEGAVRASLREDFRGEPGLADAGLAGEEDDVACALGGSGEGVADGLEFGGSPDVGGLCRGTSLGRVGGSRRRR